MSESYRYDAAGRRVEKQPASGSPTYSFYDQAGQLMYEATPGTGTATDYLYLGSQRIAHRSQPAGTVTYDYTDPQGSELAQANASGTLLARYDYAPYGNPVASLGSAPDGPGYTGHVNDPETGLVYMQARYYQPGVHFLSPDPVGPTPGDIYNFNRYAYANENPIHNTDPDGRMAGGDFTYPDGSEHYHRGSLEYTCRFCLGSKSFHQKLQRNLKWFRESITVQLGVRLGLNARFKVGKIGRLEIGAGYIGEAGELNANLDYAQIYSGKGPSVALQIARLKIGGEFGGWETRTPISISNGLSIEPDIRTKPFFLVGIESKQEWEAAQVNVSI